jgi:hypothetical protein
MQGKLQALFLLTLLCLSFGIRAQKTVVSGVVRDADTKETMPFVNVHFKGTKIGTTTDLDGKYRIETYYASDSLQASFIGYQSVSKPVKKDVSQTIDFVLSSGSIELEVAVVKPGEEENPAHPIVRNILSYKDANNREKLDAYEYEVYNKVEFDLNNISDEFREKKLLKAFDFVWDNLDSTSEKVYLPVFMTETLSNYYYRKNPKSEKEIIHGTKVSGVENQSVAQFLGDMYQNVNIYENNILVFGKSFVSPISNQGFLFYKYYLLDSAYIDNDWCYLIKFQPRRKQELTFNGEFWVNDTTFAIKRVEASIADDANINFIHGFSVRQEYDQVENEVWMLTKDQLIVDFNLTEKSMGFYGRKTTTYKDFVINKPRSEEFFSGISDIVVSEEAYQREDDYWEKVRHEELTENEAAVYAMVDSIRNVPQFRTVTDIITIFVTGYHILGNIELGPYYTLYSFNPVEGHRLRLGGRTSNAFSKRVMIEGYSAYGFRDQKFKFGGGVQYMLSKNPRQVAGFFAKHDIEQLGQAEGAFREDNILSSIFRRNPALKLTNVTQYKGFYEHEWFYGFSNQLIFTYRNLSPLGSLSYEKFSDDANTIIKVDDLTTSEITFYTRFAYKEKYLSGEFERVSLGTKYPIMEAAYSVGVPDMFGSDYQYQKLVLRVKDKIRVGPFGYANLRVEAGKIWGTLPFPLLELHQGNETFFYDETAFNTMNFFEFVSDEWLSASASYHLDGFFLNKIPLFRKLKWREVVSAKGVMGRFNPENEKLLVLPDNTFTLDKPFGEVALGVENIFKFFRVDALYRLSYLDNPNIVKFGFRAKFQVEF